LNILELPVAGLGLIIVRQQLMRIYYFYQQIARFVIMAALLASLTGCGAIRRSAMKSVADTLASPDSDVFTRDEDLELVGAAAPFGLKLYESLLDSIPDHVPLLIATCSQFTQYSYGFVQSKAEELEYMDYTEYTHQKDRALRMYLRAREYCLRGLDKRFPKVRVALLRDPKAALARAKKQDVPLLYWSAASWGGALAIGIGRPDLAGDLHVVRGLAERALELDPDYANGATHELMISLDSLDEVVGGSEDRAREHFKRAVELQKNKPQAGPYVSLATGIALKKQNREEFERLLNEALAIDPDKHPEVRLPNLAAQRRAKYFLNQVDELFPK
jgi:tetratricopeptide (TPR) repeat protein